MVEITLEPPQTNQAQRPRFMIKTSSRNARRIQGLLNVKLSQNKNKLYSLPPDPTIIRYLLEHFEDIELSDILMQYLGVLKEQQDRVFSSIEDKTPVHPDLLPFQNATVHFLDAVGKGILAHETGAGKTPPTCVALDHCGSRKVLIVCLNTLKWNWYEELNRWCVPRNIYIVDGKATKRDQYLYPLVSGRTEDQLETLKQIAYSKDEFTFILNYSNFRLMSHELIRMGFDTIVADEAHKLINRKAQQTQMFYKLIGAPAKVWLLTGTPVRNNYDDVFSLLKICDPFRFSSYWSFLGLYINYFQASFGVEISGLRDEEVFNSMLSTYMYRELKKDIRPEMPDKLYEVITVPLFGEQRRAYDQMEDELIMTVEKAIGNGTQYEKIFEVENALSLQIRLRQLTLTPEIIGGGKGSAKLDALEDLVPNFLEQKKRILIFTMFKQFVPHIAKRLDKKKIPYGILVGGMSIKQIREVERKLNEGEIDVIIGTTQAMGEGKNLQRANVVIFTDRSWVPAENKQAEDRVHRGDITEAPEIYSLIHPDSIDEDIMEVNERKEEVAQKTVGEVEVLRQMIQRKKGVSF